MEVLGQGDGVLIAGRTAAVATVVLALTVAACAWAWPFAIDDTFIELRYARHLARGAGYVWNAGGPSTDGVTPLPWALLLAPLASCQALTLLWRAKLLGAVAWGLAATCWGAAVGRVRAPWWVKAVAVLLLALCVPLAAHVVSGMETAVATALVTGAALSWRRPLLAAALAGLAASLRPELVVWSVAASAGFSLLDVPRRMSRVWWAVLLAAIPFALCALVRVVVFGRPAPLAVLAKPSDLAHGLTYAAAAALVSLAPILLASPVALSRERGPARVLAVSAVLHLAVIVAVGGDWMPYARLIVPIVPSMLFAFVLASPHTRPSLTAARAVLAIGLGAYLLPSSVTTLRSAGRDRSALIEQARPLISSAHRVATVDIGWPSAITDATIIDLAGVTDPDVASLPGGHTSKRIDAAFLIAKDPDLVLFYTDLAPDTLAAVAWNDFPRVVEARLARSDLFNEHFEPRAFLPLGKSGAGYVAFTPIRHSRD
jgi:hypothetical protein